MNEIRECLSVPDAVQDAAGAPTLAGSRSGRQAGVGGADKRDLARRRGRGRRRSAMCLGLIVPKLVLDGLSERATGCAL